MCVLATGRANALGRPSQSTPFDLNGRAETVRGPGDDREMRVLDPVRALHDECAHCGHAGGHAGGRRRGFRGNLLTTATCDPDNAGLARERRLTPPRRSCGLGPAGLRS